MTPHAYSVNIPPEGLGLKGAAPSSGLEPTTLISDASSVERVCRVYALWTVPSTQYLRRPKIPLQTTRIHTSAMRWHYFPSNIGKCCWQRWLRLLLNSLSTVFSAFVGGFGVCFIREGCTTYIYFIPYLSLLCISTTARSAFNKRALH